MRPRPLASRGASLLLRLPQETSRAANGASIRAPRKHPSTSASGSAGCSLDRSPPAARASSFDYLRRLLAPRPGLASEHHANTRARRRAARPDAASTARLPGLDYPDGILAKRENGLLSPVSLRHPEPLASPCHPERSEGSALGVSTRASARERLREKAALALPRDSGVDPSSLRSSG